MKNQGQRCPEHLQSVVVQTLTFGTTVLAQLLLNSMSEENVIKGIYTSASGMLPQVKKQEITANNVANAGATGFKKDRLFTKELTEAEKKSLQTKADWVKPMVSNVFVDHTPGVLIEPVIL